MLQRSLTAFSIVFSLAFHLCLALLAPSAASAAILTLGNGLKPISALHVGDNLVVELADAIGGHEYQALLIDDHGEIVSQTTFFTNSLGQSGKVTLWWRCGVVGCQNARFVDPAKSLFFDYAQAELELDGRVFVVQVVDPIWGGVVLSQSLPLHATTEPRYYFSDAAGCPILVASAFEPLYVSGLHVPATVAALPLGNLFLTDSFDDMSNGMPVVDLRGLPEGQQLTIPLSGDPMLEEVLEVAAPPLCLHGKILPPTLPEPEGGSTTSGPREPLKILEPVHMQSIPCTSDKPWLCPPCMGY